MRSPAWSASICGFRFRWWAACRLPTGWRRRRPPARQPLVSRRGVDGNVRAFHHMAEWILAEAAGPVRHCELGGHGAPNDIIAPHPLPADVGSYARRHPRFPVDWAASLEVPNGVTAVRVRDLSATGAAVETTLPLREGDTGILHFDQLAGKPALAVIVPCTRSG